MIGLTESVLPNGLRLVTIEQPHLHSACVSLLVRCGSRHERPRQWGLSHLLEHMLFRGSQHYPDAAALARAFERHGGTLQAATWRDHTQLWTPIHPSRLQDALLVLSDMVVRPRFSDLEVERRIVEEELQQDLDQRGQDTDINNLSRASIWHGHPMGRRIAGSFASLRSFNVADVREHHAQNYVAENAVLCVAGRVEAEKVQAMAARTFGEMPRGRRGADGDKAHFAPCDRLLLGEREGVQLDIQISFEALPDLHPDFAALELLTRILDDGSSSRLRQAICERHGLVYELSCGLDCYADCGLYDIEMRVAPRRAASAIALALEAITALCDRGVTDEELEVVRERALHDLEFSIDSTEDLAEFYGSKALFGKTETMEKQSAAIVAVKSSDLQRVARTIFLGGRIHATLMGPVQSANLKRIEKLFLDFPALG